MNQNQAKEYYEKLFVNYPDVLSVEEATTLLGFKSQTAIIRRIHQHRIRCLKVGRSFMIPKEYLADPLYLSAAEQQNAKKPRAIPLQAPLSVYTYHMYNVRGGYCQWK